MWSQLNRKVFDHSGGCCNGYAGVVEVVVVVVADVAQVATSGSVGRGGDHVLLLLL